MEGENLNQLTITKIGFDDFLPTWFEAFLIDRKVQNLSPKTIDFYRSMLNQFYSFCESQAISYIRQIEPNTIRKYLMYLEQKRHNPGGVNSAYRTLRAFLNWWEAETEPEGWKNPIKKVKAPKMAVEPLKPVELGIIDQLLGTCQKKDFLSLRDKALILFLLDTGARAAEICAVNLEDVDLAAGSVLIRQGKGRKPRIVFLGQKSRRALRAYLKYRHTHTESDNVDVALWITARGGWRLTYDGLNQIIKRRSKAANVKKPGLHDFRRAFALNFLRNGGDVYSLQKLMGHADLQVLRRYLALTDEDTQKAHAQFSPVDHHLPGGKAGA